jgi:putative PEP-CTERM system TPR-repeat lipoprotein
MLTSVFPAGRPGWVAPVLAVVVVISGCSEPDISAREQVQQARQARSEGELRTAMIHLKKALQQNSRHPEARWLLGRLHVAVGQGAAAEKELRRAAELGIPRQEIAVPLARALRLQGAPQRLLETVQVDQRWPAAVRAEVLAQRGEAHLALGHWERAADRLKRAMRLDPESVTARVGLGRKAAQQGDLAAGKEWVQQALAIDANSADAWSLAGDIARWQGDWQQAVHEYGEAIGHRFRANPDRLKRALAFVALGEYDKAGDDLAVLRRRGVTDARFHFVDGLRHFRREAFEPAAAAFQEALRRRSGYAVAAYYLGAAHYRLGHWNRAAERLEGLRDRDPLAVPVRRILGAIYLEQGRPDRAREVLAPVLQARPEDRMALNLAAHAALRTGDTVAGLRHLRRLARLQPDSAATQTRLGLGLLLHGERSQGLEALGKAADLAPRYNRPRILAVMTHLGADDYGKALKAAESLAESRPDSPVPWNLKGLAYLGQERPQAAERAFRKALDLGPGDPAASHNLAALLRRQGKPQAARALYREVLERKPANLPTLLALARLEMDAGRRDAARQALRQALDAHPEATGARALLARLERYAGEPRQALTVARKGQGLLPPEPALLEQAGRAYLALGDAPAAEEAFRRWLDERPDAAAGRYLLGRALAAQGELAAAERAIDRAIAADPDRLEARLAKVRLLMARGDGPGAAGLLDRLRSDHPEQPDLLALAGKLALGQGRPGEAVAPLRQALAKLPVSEWQLALAQAHWRRGQRSQALAALEQWLARYPADTGVRFQLGVYRLKGGQEAAARQSFAAVLERNPEHVGALNNLAWLLRGREPERGLALARRARDLAPHNPGVRDTLAVLLTRNGQARKAVRILRELAEARPDDLEVRWHLASALARAGHKGEARTVVRALLDRGERFPHRDEALAFLERLGPS